MAMVLEGNLFAPACLLLKVGVGNYRHHWLCCLNSERIWVCSIGSDTSTFFVMSGAKFEDVACLHVRHINMGMVKRLTKKLNRVASQRRRTGAR